MIFITHPQHGEMNVMEHEVEEHKKHGWVVDDWQARRDRKLGIVKDAPVRNKPGPKPKAQ